MAVTITSAGLVSVYPEWTRALSRTPDVVDSAIDEANAKSFELYTKEAEERARRYLEASAILYVRAYGRDMQKPEDGSKNTYRAEADRMDMLKGAAERTPGWTLPAGVS